MMGSMMRRAITSGGTDHLRAKTFIADAKSGADSVDFLISGDSNTNYKGWGWCDGLVHALVSAGASHYATPLIPVFSRESGTFYGYQSKFDAYGRINADGSIANAGGTGALGGTLVRADSAPSGLYDLLKRASGNLQPNASPFWFGYFAGSSNWADFLGGIYTVDDSAFTTGAPISLAWQASALRYRIVHAKGPGMGSFQPTFRRNGGGDALVVAGSRVQCADSAGYSWDTAELTISANAGRVSGNQYLAAYADNTWGSYHITAPVALAMHSLSRSVKGIACQSLDHYGGATTKQVSDNAVGAPLVIKQYMREIRARQIACGGSGRLIVMFQGGVNGTGSSTWAADCTAFMETCRTCWTDLGYSVSDLGFLGLTSHQVDSSDGMTTLRASAATLSTTYTIVDGMAIAPYASLISGSYYQNASTERQHLNEAGYKWACAQLLAALA